MKASPAALREAIRVMAGTLRSLIIDSTCDSCGHPELFIPLGLDGQPIDGTKADRVVLCRKCGDAHVLHAKAAQ